MKFLAIAAVVFGVNLLPAFGPPTWAVLVFFRLHDHANPVLLVAWAPSPWPAANDPHWPAGNLGGT